MAENDVEEGEEQKSSKKMIIIIAIVLLLAGGGAAYYFMMGDSVATDDETVEEVEEGDAGDDEAVDNVYYDLTKPLLVNFSKDSTANLIQVSISLLVKGEDTLEALKKHEPMIRNNLLMIVSANSSGNLITREGKQTLREQMLKEIGSIMEKMTGKNKVSDLFFTTFVMQ
ncbi:MAG: flagellar basal body-associated FliL family protein [Methylococcales bacterium]|nr:flagellar basal body-associated FliL family protein [Methylococcales bacterium]